MATKARPSPRLVALETELDMTRVRLSHDLAALRGKLTPAGLAEEASVRLRGNSRGYEQPFLGTDEQRSSGWHSVARSSPALTLLGAGLAWLLLRSSRSQEEVM